MSLGFRTSFVGAFHLLAAVASTSAARADNPFPFCDSQTLEREKREIKSNLDDNARLREMERTYNEISALYAESRRHTEVPLGYVKNCLAKERQLMLEQTQACSGSARAKFEFHYVIGEFREQEGNVKEAYDSFTRAAQINPQDYTAPVRAFKLWIQMQSDRFAAALKNPNGVSRKDLDEILNETNRLLTPLAQNPKAPRNIKIDAYRVRAQFLDDLERHAEAMGDWRQILALDPKNIEALKKLAVFEMDRGRKVEARKYLEQLAPLTLDNLAIQKDLLNLQLESEDYQDALRTADLALAKRPGDLELQAFRAHALAGNNRLNEAIALSAKVFKAAPTNKIAQRTESFIHVLLGDAHAREKMPGRALGEYEQALTLNPGDKKLRARMATVIFELRQDTDFKPREATRKDLDSVVKLLDPVLKSDFVEQRTVEIYISSAVRSSHPEAGAAGCARYRDDFGSMPTLNLVLDCAAAFKAAGQEERARKTIEEAMADPKFKNTAGALASALTELK